jgi:hypothetical protein
MKNNKSFARKSFIRHPNGVRISTPLLIPSFSSKGFFIDTDGESELDKLYDVSSEYISDTVLISAFDIWYKNIKNVNYSIAEIIFVDSGGYEVANSYDLSTVYMSNNSKKEWSEDKLHDVYNSLPKDLALVLVNYDHPTQRLITEKQIEKAECFFHKYPYHLHTFLVKPENEEDASINMNSILNNIDKLGGFNIIGITEKELGDSILNKMTNIARIRIALDNAGLLMPLHIYGSLDPVTSILYFISGAEIFDGLTWLRYGFSDGYAWYYSNYGVKNHGVDKDEERIKLLMLQNNISYLATMKNQMKTFLLDGKFRAFGNNEKIISDAYNLLRAEIGG